MPCAIASAGLRKRTSRPSTTSRPSSNRSAPATTRASSVRPAPSRPEMPSTSPACSEKLMSDRTPPHVEPLDAQQLGAALDAAPSGKCSLRSRFAISRTSSGTVT